MHLRFVRSSLAGVVAFLVFAGGQLSAQTTTTARKPVTPPKSTTATSKSAAAKTTTAKTPQTRTSLAKAEGRRRRTRTPRGRQRAPANGRGLKREAMTPRFKRDVLGNLIPDVRAAAAIVFDPQTNKVLWEQNAHEQRVDRQPDEDHDGGHVRRRRPGPHPERRRDADRHAERVGHVSEDQRCSQLRDLLHLTLIASDNAATRVLARTSEGGTAAFVSRMNEMAAHLGLTNTQYADPSGLDARNMSSAYDLSHLIAFAARRREARPDHADTQEYEVARRRRVHSDAQHQPIARSGDRTWTCVGGKTGFISKAGYCLATLLRIPQGPQVAVVVLGAANSTTRFWEARHLFNWVVGRWQASVADGLRSHRGRNSVGAPRRSRLPRSCHGFPAAVPRFTFSWSRRRRALGQDRRPRRTSPAHSRRPSSGSDTTSTRRAAALSRHRRRRHARASPSTSGAVRRDDVTFHVAAGRRTATGRVRRVPEYFDRAGLYGEGGADYRRQRRRFDAARAGRARVRGSGEVLAPSDVVHAHDWQTGLHAMPASPPETAGRGSRAAGPVFTIHNLAYQGLFPRESVPALGLPWDSFGSTPGVLGQLQLPQDRHRLRRLLDDRQSDLRARDPDAGVRRGMEGVLRALGRGIVGILNGIDTDVWNPADGSVAAGALRRQRPLRQGRVQARAARALSGCRSATTRSGGRSSAWSRGWSIRRGSTWSMRPATSWSRWTRPGCSSGRASRGTKRFLRDAGRSASRRASASTSASTRAWRTWSRPAPTCS